MKKILVVNLERCTGCHRCELYCSLQHFGVLNPARARIHVIRTGAADAPIICLQCGLCTDTCPTGAIAKDQRTGAIVIDADKCTGCGNCVAACPYGAMTIDPMTNTALKCDLCDGAPECVKHCQERALLHIDVKKAPYYRQVAFARLQRKERVPLVPYPK